MTTPRKTIIGSIAGAAALAVGGLGGTAGYQAIVVAADQHIDERVDQGIKAYDIQQLDRQIEFYETKQDMAPDRYTQDDETNKSVLERQLKRAKGTE